MGSPRGVPVPCTATTATRPGAVAALARADATRAACAGPFGAVRLLDRPSCPTAAPCSRRGPSGAPPGVGARGSM